MFVLLLRRGTVALLLLGREIDLGHGHVVGAAVMSLDQGPTTERKLLPAQISSETKHK